MGFWVMLGWWLVTTVVAELLRPKPDIQNAKPQGIDGFNFPTVDASRPIPVIWGKVKLKGPNILWYGNFLVVPLTETVKTGWFSSETITTGYRYHIGMDIALCHGPGVSVLDMAIGEKIVPNFSDAGGIVGDENMFGGDDSEGGFLAYLTVHDGDATEQANPYLVNQLSPELVPPYRGVTRVVIGRPAYIGTSVYLKEYAFYCLRNPTGLTGLVGKQYFADWSVNPAEVLYELLTNTKWGMGYTANEVDTANFVAAGETLYTESNGIALIWDGKRTIFDMCTLVLDQIDGALFMDLSTGKLSITLARGGYVVGDLPVLDESNISELKSFSRASWEDTTNEVQVVYCDASQDFTDQIATAQDPANIEAQGGQVVSVQIQYPGCCNATLAAQLAARDLRELSYPYAKCTLVINRSGSTFQTGSLVSFNWAELGIADMAMRVLQVRYGTIDNGLIELDLVEDMYGRAETFYADVPETGWVSIPNAAENVVTYELATLPYFFAAQSLVYNAKNTSPMMLCHAPNGSCMSYDYYAYEVDTYKLGAKNRGFAPYGIMANSIDDFGGLGSDTSTIVVAGSHLFDTYANASWTDIKVGLANIILIGTEYIAFENIAYDDVSGEYTLSNLHRGIFGTIPAPHGLYNKVWGIKPGCFGFHDDVSYSNGDPVHNKAVVTATGGALLLADTTNFDFNLSNLPFKPYPPSKVRFGLTSVAWDYFPVAIPTGSMSIIMLGRDKDVEITEGVLQDFDNDSEVYTALPASHQFKILIYDETNTLVRTVLQTGQTYDYDEATEIADSTLSRLNGSIKYVISIYDGSVYSSLNLTHTVDRPGYGTLYGDYYGGY